MENNILDYIQNRNFNALKQELASLQPVDMAEILEELDSKNLMIVFRMLPKETAAEVFSHLSSKQQEVLSLFAGDEELHQIIDELFFDDMIDYLEEMPANVVKKILKNAPEAERKLINQFLKYPEDSAGSLMTIEFVDLKKQMTVKEALEHVRFTGTDKETVYTCYVIDQFRRLEGIISLKDLVLAPATTVVADIMNTDFISVHTHEDQEEIAETFKRYDLLSLPVVDMESRLVGIITIDDIVDVIEQENTEDFHKMAALRPSEENYLDTGVISLARQRILWLLILMISATFTGGIMEKFENSLESVVALTFFIPMLMNTGGNAGSQSSTLIIRSLALGKVEIRDVLKVIWKELRVSILVGIVLALFSFLTILLRGFPVNISITVSATLIIVIILAKMIGGILPMIAKSFKLDPAIMASPLITTIVDAVTLFSYFSIATWILNMKA
jgi:magnesium transporter